jgi:hypothetical protein
MKFYTRISKTYRKDKWPTLLSAILTQNLACAKKLGLVDVSIECLLELLSLSSSGRESIGIVTELHALMASDVAGMRRRSGMVKSQSLGVETGGPLSESFSTPDLSKGRRVVCVGVSMDDITPLVRCTVQFSTGNTVIGENEAPVMYQVSLSCMNRYMIEARASVMKPCKIVVKFSDPEFNHCFKLGSGGDIGPLVLFDNDDAVVAFDNIYAVDTCVFQGVIKGTRPLDLTILSVSIVSESVKHGGNSFSMDFNIAERRESSPQRRVWFYRNEGRVMRRFFDGTGELSILRYIE